MNLKLNYPQRMSVKSDSSPTKSWQALKQYFQQYVDPIEQVEKLAFEAFENKGSLAWRKIQFLLFDMNLRLIREGFGLGTSRFLREWELRHLIEQIEQQYLPQEELPTEIITVEAFMPWLKERISQHRVNHHPLFNLFDHDDLSNEEIRYFLANYRVNMQRFHLHVAAFSLIVPFEMREELYDNLYDEFGQGDFTQAHPNLFEPLMDYFGGAREEDINPETCHLLNTKINLCWFADGLHYGIGGMGALELAIPLQQRRILAHLRRRGLSEDMVKFFVVHCELDEDHGEGWFAAGMPYMHTIEDLRKVFSSAMRMLEARAGVYDGILNGILERRN
ncbi:iron-containing redox enzyme family protein [Aetokthonos hydrillicola Thurmond2011]|jgi:pyrroloquinoline quinone (PQQ) biosynthesis protein C|uniref:Iron-containing redox enzyme family protein n=1 Tax=Aetokthonos hydrillicola Thurmond2011 TaxID=2712845 RepID=A0AAP5I3J8_9CYAN|nr:iron-containing redox enzyme family protein [Aetokthonos hydrillicola]MBO3462208.1 iron-containing redox enzyme family protein [Aetokthonos hydrillicola CCALA 1050]MBW4585094.1 iron-containing redox enzyme family protein [Aetokthonos hydrillicola CCALA 1050]MDR9894146.1 iron-containing redox enzyme family protein [Aetokthonos hydrillicola Thurmond2011]